MLISIYNNQKITVDPPSVGTGTVELRCSNIPLTNGEEYVLSLKMRASRTQNVDVDIYDSGLSTQSLDKVATVVADTWKQFAWTFTAQATDLDSKLRIHLNMDAVQDFYVDDVVLLNLTKEEKEYRLMRIKGSMRPGSFTQELTLREITESETA